MGRKLTIKGAQKQLTKLVREYVLKRDGSCCQKCGKYVTGKNAHLSHVIPKSRGNRLRWDPNNLKILCFYHHIHWWHKNPVEAGEWFKDKFPERWEYLQEHQNEIVKWKIEDYKRMIKEMKRLKKEIDY